MNGRPLRVLLCHPGASWSTADVYDGLLYGLRQHGVLIETYRLDTRIEISHRMLHAMWRAKKKKDATAIKPTQHDVLYHASLGALEKALRHRVDVVLIVSAMFFHPDVLQMLKQAGLTVTVLFTESPYDMSEELAFAARGVDGCWTNERTCVPAFRRLVPHSGYLAHAWHPERHVPIPSGDDAAVAAHDVVFVGSGFPERIEWFNAIDWTGIDLGLYGFWNGFGVKPALTASIHEGNIDNAQAAALYRRAKIGLNLYRTRGSKRLPLSCVPESLSPRAYELAACGAFSISDDRAEVRDVFGDRVPTFRTPTEAAALLRLWLADDAGRQRIAAQLPACVAEASWTERAKTVLGDLRHIVSPQAACVAAGAA